MRIGIIIAMPEEALFLNTMLTNAKHQEHTAFQVNCGTYKNHEISTVVSGIGKAMSAAATTMLIEKHNVDILLNIGTAGGVNSQVGDIIVSQEAFFHDVDVTAFGYKPYQIPGEPVYIKSTRESTPKIINLEQVTLELSGLQVGKVATGDKFVAEKNYVKNLKACTPDLKAIDMEAAAIALVCSKYQKEFLLIKKISDLADEEAAQSFTGALPDFEQKVSLILEKLLNLW